MTYIIAEIQTNAEGVSSVLNSSFTSRNEAESKYFDILKYAAISSVPTHAAMIFTEDGRLVESRYWKHPVLQPESNEDVIIDG